MHIDSIQRIWRPQKYKSLSMNSQYNSASKLRILSSNVRGFNDIVKRKAMMIHFDSFKPDIICVGDTHFDDTGENLFKNEYGNKYKSFHSNFSSNSRGTAIIIRKELPIMVDNIDEAADGNRITVNFKFEDKSFSLSCIYGPNNDDPMFFENVFEKAFEQNCEYTLITGDFNTAPNHDLDYTNYLTVRNPNARNMINDSIAEYNCTDTYRYLHGEKREYSYRSDSGPQMSRIDLCIVSSNLTPYLIESSIQNSFLSDHDILLNTIDFQKIRKGKGNWRLDNELLEDNEYVGKIESVIHETLMKYVKVHGYDNFINECTVEERDDFVNATPTHLQSQVYSINPSMLLEMLINDIRNETIGYSIAKNKAKKEHKRYLINKIASTRILIEERGGANNPINAVENRNLQEYKEQYETIIEQEARRVMQRDKILSKIEGEVPSKYFCNLEKVNAASKYIPKLKIDNPDGTTRNVTKQSEIESEIRNFYQNLYSSKDRLLENTSIEEFLELDQSEIHPKITSIESANMSSKITIEEMKAVLDNSKNNSAPGMTGLTFEFYKKFWSYLGFFLVEAANHSYASKCLPEKLSSGIISLLPKGDKNKEQLNNWRPLTLLSVEYKLISGCIAKRLGKVMGKLVGSDQNGFVGGRYIGESIRTVYDTMCYAKNKELTGIILLVDFKKAFDSLSHRFLLKCLKFFGFEQEFISWIELLVYNFKVCTTHAGNMSSPFFIRRGSKQGDPVSSLLFILCLEILSIKLEKTISGLKIGNMYVKKTLYADDLTIVLEYKEEELRRAVHVLDQFYKISGLEINRSKTQVVVIGKIPANNYKFCDDLNLTWKQSFKLLGIDFDSQLENIFDNYATALEKVKQVINNWRYRYLTVYGRAVVAKTLLLPKFAHIHLVLPNLPKSILKEIESTVYNFIWKGTDKVCRTDAVIDELKGGMNFPDIRISMVALKISWLRRGYTNSNAKWVHILNETIKEHNEDYDLDKVLTNLSLDEVKKIRLTNPFWRSCFKNLNPISKELVNKSPMVLLMNVIWGSNLILNTNRIMSRRNFSFISRNINTIADTLTYENGRLAFKANHLLSDNPNASVNGLANFRLIIKHYLLNFNIQIGTDYNYDILARPSMPILIKLIHMSKKGCSAWTKLLKRGYSTNNIRERELKWEGKIGRIMGVHYWDACYKDMRQITYSNKIKWFQFQVLRGCLKVNKVVSKFKPEVSIMCTFCGVMIESTEHLLFRCNVTNNFIQECMQFYNSLGNFMTLANISEYDFLFILRKRLRNNRSLFILLHIKYFIWLARCKGEMPRLQSFRPWFTKELEILSKCLDKYHNLDFVNNLYDLTK